MAGIGEVEHTPELGIGVGFGYLEEREIARVWGRQGKLVDGGQNTGVRDCPFQVARGFAADYFGRRRGGVPGV